MTFKIQVFIGKTNKIPNGLLQDEMVYICDEKYEENGSDELENLVYLTAIMGRFDSLEEAVDSLPSDWMDDHNSELSLIPLTENLSELTKTFRESAKRMELYQWSYRDAFVCAPADSKESVALAEQFVRENTLRHKWAFWK